MELNNKIVFVLLLFLIILYISIPTFADMSGPIYNNMTEKIKVINKNGAKFYTLVLPKNLNKVFFDEDGSINLEAIQDTMTHTDMEVTLGGYERIPYGTKLNVFMEGSSIYEYWNTNASLIRSEEDKITKQLDSDYYVLKIENEDKLYVVSVNDIKIEKINVVAICVIIAVTIIAVIAMIIVIKKRKQ